MAKDKQETPKAGKAAKSPEKVVEKVTKKAAATRKGPQAEKVKSKEKSAKKSVTRSPLMPRTPYVKWGEHPAKWRLIDATGIPLGRLSSQIARMLMGKESPAYTRHADSGDFIVVTNAKDVVLTGKKWEQKNYYWHTQYPGGIKTIGAKELRKQNPERLVEWAVWGMLPKFKGHMVRKWHSKLFVYPGADHPHQAQKPEAVKLTNIGHHAN